MEDLVASTLSYFEGRRVLVTGHSGFKGSWLCRILERAGAEVWGYSLPSPTDPSLFALARVADGMQDITGDVRDLDLLRATFEQARPQVVLHLAAQPIVLDGYRDPHGTYATNVMGTVNVLECARTTDCVESLVNVTTDKVYRNNEWVWGYREDEFLDGYDPYSNSKSCSELVTHAYARSFLAEAGVAVSTARAGNVIGGGDFAPDRIIPDCVRAAAAGRPIVVRNPHSTRPYQHVLEPLLCYLMIAAAQAEDPSIAGSYNVGPDECDCVTTSELVGLFCDAWGDGMRWESRAREGAPHEANFLKLDCSKIKHVFGWKPRWHIDKAVRMTCAWSKAWLAGDDVSREMDREIDEFLEGDFE